MNIKRVFEIDNERLAKIFKEKNLTGSKIGVELGYDRNWFVGQKTQCGGSGLPPVVVELLQLKYGISYEDIKPLPKEKKPQTALPEGLSDTDTIIALIQKTYTEVASVRNNQKDFSCRLEKMEKRESDVSIKLTVELLRESMVVLSYKIEELEKTVSKMVEKTGNEKPVAVVKKNYEDLPSLDYMKVNVDNMTIEQWEDKVSGLIRLVAPMKGHTYKDTLSQYYYRMNTEYGVVYDELKKKFFHDFGRPSKSSLELMFVEKVFRKVFWNIIVSDYYTMRETKVARNNGK